MNPSYAHTLYDMTHMGDMVATDSPNIFCTTIPSHWRSNKSLPSNFRVFIFDEVKDGTIVTIRVGNDDNFSGELRNNTASVKDNVAQFNDLRFIGRSGRGKCFSLSLIVNSSPVVMTTLSKAIKITVDGPREPRNKTPFVDVHSCVPSFHSIYAILKRWLERPCTRRVHLMRTDT
ncbi:hypothetical protein HAZT_HAZT009066, partial [Hyalella azteca]